MAITYNNHCSTNSQTANAWQNQISLTSFLVLGRFFSKFLFNGLHFQISKVYDAKSRLVSNYKICRQTAYTCNDDAHKTIPGNPTAHIDSAEETHDRVPIPQV